MWVFHGCGKGVKELKNLGKVVTACEVRNREEMGYGSMWKCYTRRG